MAKILILRYTEIFSGTQIGMEIEIQYLQSLHIKYFILGGTLKLIGL
jgi:hypothetical protein